MVAAVLSCHITHDSTITLTPPYYPNSARWLYCMLVALSLRTAVEKYK